MDGFQRESLTSDEGKAFVSAPVGEPIPGKEACNRHDQPPTLGGNGLEERFRSGCPSAVQHDCTSVTQDADVHGAGMPVEATVKWVLSGVESP
jgi:hypothetical protein